MANLVFFNRRFKPGWQMTALALLAIVFFVYLGLWQLQRAQEKKIMLAAHAQLASQNPIHWKPGMVNPKQYEPLVIEGNLLSETFLLDNQHYQHHFGYDVLTPMQLNDKTIVLIDRGWVRGDDRRHHFPEIVNPKHVIQLSGQAYYPSKKNWILGQGLEKKRANLAIVELIDTQLISQFLHKSVYPFIIRLDKTAANGFVREWPLVSMPPERHNAYAFQWFAMALVLLVIFIGLNMKKIHENSET